ncbi:MAG: M20/M25/M40 family metallo-hydrolase [Solirubrobacterales bacterium]
MARDRLLERFERLCATRSPTGEERAVADAVTRELRELGCEVTEDEAAGPAHAGAGNLIARRPGSGDGFVMFCAHLDTVPHADEIEVELADGVYRSRGDTILGADNKAAVAVLIELAAAHAKKDAGVGLELVLTVAEETGLRGAKELDTSALRSEFGFVLDHSSPMGEVIIAAPTYKRMVAEFEGIAAHSGIRPEAGRSAISAAASAIAGMQLGRLDDETSANVGVIHGGFATNIVASECRIEAEARSLDHARAAETMGEMVDACTWAAGEHGCDVDLEVTELFRAYRLPKGSAPAALARDALARCGYEASDVVTGGGSDANALIAAGFDCALLANGTSDNHTPNEAVAADSITGMLRVCETLLTLTAERSA